MNRFQSSTPRLVIGLTAVAMTVITFGLFVVVPATIESGSVDARTQAARVVAPAATAVVTRIASL